MNSGTHKPDVGWTLTQPVSDSWYLSDSVHANTPLCPETSHCCSHGQGRARPQISHGHGARTL